MDQFSNNISDYAFGDAKSSLLSLQFLDEIVTKEPQDCPAKMNQSHAIKSEYQPVHGIEPRQYSCQPLIEVQSAREGVIRRNSH